MGERPLVEIVCKTCYKRVTRKLGSLTCLDCSNKYYKPRDNSFISICKYCGCKFKAPDKRVKICSAECRDIYNTKKINENWALKKTKKNDRFHPWKNYDKNENNYPRNS